MSVLFISKGAQKLLSVRDSVSRSCLSLNGVWDFAVDVNNDGVERRVFASRLENPISMPVPSSYNDITTDTDIHDHVGLVWYQKEVLAPRWLGNERLIVRFGAITHTGRVWVDGQEVAKHIGGYLPFEADITDFVTPGETFRLTVAVDNRLTWDTIPVGQEVKDDTGKRKLNYFYDFFNYSGIHRPVWLYTRPEVAVTDVTVTTDVHGQTGIVHYQVQAEGAKEISVRVLDANGVEVAAASGEKGQVEIDQVILWQPGKAYLYTLEVHADDDVYPQPFGVRTVEVKDSQLLINGTPFYFRGYGRHEDNLTRGRGFDPVMMVHDFEIMKWQGANSFRTSHYPYAEEILDYADQQGFVVIGETAAVGLNLKMWPGEMGGVGLETFCPDTITERTRQTHADHIREMISRDKNHPSIVIWSIANEPESDSQASYDYFAPLAKVARQADQSRPIGYVNVQMCGPDVEKCVGLFDVVMLNRYNGWYTTTGNLPVSERKLRKEIDAWIKMAPGKPIIFTEYGPDTLKGMTDFHRRPWSEEYQEDMLGMFHRVFDDYREVIGEQMWNFADFQTIPGILRVGGNRKGMFTRDRQPKAAAYTVRKRWLTMRDKLGF